MTSVRDDTGSTSTEDNTEVVRGQDVALVPSLDTYYSSHIAAVCESMNAEAKAPPPLAAMSKAEKRRETNRISARRSRKRRRDEIEKVEEELRRLAAETEELKAERERLQQELQEESLRASTPRVLHTNSEQIAGRVPHEAAQQMLLQNRPQLISSDTSHSGYSSHSLLQAVPHPQASFALFASIPTNSAFFGASSAMLISQNPMERSMLALLQNNALSQVAEQVTTSFAGSSALQMGHNTLFALLQSNTHTHGAQQPAQQVATAPSWPTGIPSNAPNNTILSVSAPQTRNQTAQSFMQALLDISSLSTGANALPQQQGVAHLNALVSSRLFGASELGYTPTGSHEAGSPYHSSGGQWTRSNPYGP